MRLWDTQEGANEEGITGGTSLGLLRKTRISNQGRRIIHWTGDVCSSAGRVLAKHV